MCIGTQNTTTYLYCSSQTRTFYMSFQFPQRKRHIPHIFSAIWTVHVVGIAHMHLRVLGTYEYKRNSLHLIPIVDRDPFRLSRSGPFCFWTTCISILPLCLSLSLPNWVAAIRSIHTWMDILILSFFFVAYTADWRLALAACLFWKTSLIIAALYSTDAHYRAPLDFFLLRLEHTLNLACVCMYVCKL